jgi:hypothetical protein
MIYKEHYIELFVNGQQVELEDQKSLNMRFNNVLYDPSKITNTQAEYSFEFEVPSTPNNDRIFDYANNLSKLSKFRSRLKADVYADGSIIFEGTITLNGYKNKMYSCNLVSVKVYSLEEIFEDAVLTDMDNWKIPFSGAPTINEINANNSSKVVFPLTSYGAFQKTPVNSDGAGNDYTSKYDLDEYNRWYVESFYPSLNMLETVKKAFEWKGYKVGGDAFNDSALSNIFMSTNLASGQSPVYNLGNPKFGKIDLNVTWNSQNKDPCEQDLKYPYFPVGGGQIKNEETGEIANIDREYNLTKIDVYNVLNQGNVIVSSQSYMYQPPEHLIVIPADGFYKIELEASGELNESLEATLTAKQWVRDVINVFVPIMPYQAVEKDVEFKYNFFTTTPLELHLVKNYDDNIELIKGQRNVQIIDGYPEHQTWGGYSDAPANYVRYNTCFPHEKLGTQEKLSGANYIYVNPTKMDGNELIDGNKTSYKVSDCKLGYVPETIGIAKMAYDPAVSDAFICGFSSMGIGTIATVKNGYSWSKTYSQKTDNFYNMDGYYKCDGDGQFTATTYNQNTYDNIPSYGQTLTNNSFRFKTTCCVKLKKNDVLQLMAINRAYETMEGNKVKYTTSINAHLTIEAMSDDSYEGLRAKDFNYDTPTEFDTDLRVTNFLNNEKKISDFVQNVVDAFNLDIIQNNNNIQLNVKKKFDRKINTAVDIDDRVNSANIEVSRIDYPKSMAVRYKIDTDEHGFYISVPPEKIDDPDWKKYGNSGFSVVELNDDLYAAKSSDKNLQFSYTWYDNFNWFPVDSAFTKTSSASTTLSIPVISKEQYMIDGYDYTESLKHDGYGLTQRFWYRPIYTNTYVWTRTYPVERINVYSAVNQYNGLILSYKINEESLLRKYFNITPYLSSNYIEVEAYLNPDEYDRIKNGSLVHVDSDLYIPIEINGYDPSSNSPTTLKLMKCV